MMNAFASFRRPANTAGLLVLLFAVFLGGTSFGVKALQQATPITDEPVVDCEFSGPGVGAEPYIRSELFFGTTLPDGSEITDEQWTDFLEDEVTPRFPAGLTVLEGYGQFQNSAGEIARESSIVLILLYPVEVAEESSALIEEIRDEYETQFDQESVLRSDNGVPVCASF